MVERPAFRSGMRMDRIIWCAWYCEAIEDDPSPILTTTYRMRRAS